MQNAPFGAASADDQLETESAHSGGYACGDKGLRLVSGRVCAGPMHSDRLLSLHIYTS
jgi:hypothetical protein